VQSVRKRGLLQERLALFGRWFAIVAGAYYVIANIPLDLAFGFRFDWMTEYFGFHEVINLELIAGATAVWLATRGRPRSEWLLGAIDALAVIMPLLLLALVVLSLRPPEQDVDELFTILLAATQIIVVRGIVVPSSARRTLVLSTLAYLPIFGATVYSMLAVSTLPPRSAINLALSAGLWGLVAVASAGVTSRILFRLRREVAAVRQLGQYTLEQKIGEGAMGIVYRASHALLRRPTAIKLLARGKNAEDDLRRFEREVQQTARLTHPNTIAIYDFGRDPDEIFYYVMEYIEGISLEDLVKRYGPQPACRVIHMLRQVCGALGEAHGVGLIHRDIKPANLMLCRRGGIPDVVKVLDFGLVKPMHGDSGRSTAGAAVGTPLYMSPEAIEHPDAVDQRSDLYAVAATGYFLLTGTHVFDGDTTVAICSKHLGETPQPPSERLGAPVPVDLEALLMRCLEKKPADRPASAAELERLLSQCAAATDWSPGRVADWWRDFKVPPPPVAADAEARQLTVDVARVRAR